jgi:hypothetical protein
MAITDEPIAHEHREPQTHQEEASGITPPAQIPETDAPTDGISVIDTPEDPATLESADFLNTPNVSPVRRRRLLKIAAPVLAGVLGVGALAFAKSSSSAESKPNTPVATAPSTAPPEAAPHSGATAVPESTTVVENKGDATTVAGFDIKYSGAPDGWRMLTIAEQGTNPSLMEVPNGIARRSMPDISEAMDRKAPVPTALGGCVAVPENYKDSAGNRHSATRLFINAPTLTTDTTTVYYGVTKGASYIIGIEPMGGGKFATSTGVDTVRTSVAPGFENQISQVVYDTSSSLPNGVTATDAESGEKYQAALTMLVVDEGKLMQDQGLLDRACAELVQRSAIQKP